MHGTYKLLLKNSQRVYAHTRTLENQMLLIVSNFFDSETKIVLPELKTDEIILSNYKDSTTNLESLVLRPYESIVFVLK